ncbi:MAG: CueP family metal-binding protein [Propionibacteriaceae bacterium]|nr:CueP family metal-binding protein [Propionibacteriaceae bacterium]
MKFRTAIAASLALAAGFLLPGCAGATPTPDSTTPAPSVSVTEPAGTDILADHGLAGLDARQIIERLDTLPVSDRPTDLIASIRPDQLLLTDDQDRELTVPMPSDEFYLSLAPYLNGTHDCHFHSLTTCLGELQNVDVSLTVTDAATGEPILEEDLRTYDNGFVGVWLPRDIDADITVEYDGRTATTAISTRGAEAATCLTTLQLT